MHTNEFDSALDILIGGDFTEEITDKLDEDETCHISVWVEDSKVKSAVFSDGWAGGKTVDLTDDEKEHILEFIEKEEIYDFERGGIID